MAAKKKTTKKTASKTTKGKRYTPEERQKVLALVSEVNAKKGRGGITAAAKKFGVTALSISNWIKKEGGAATKSVGKTARRAGRPKASGGSAWDELVALKADIDSLEKELETKRTRFDKLKTKI